MSCHIVRVESFPCQIRSVRLFGGTSGPLRRRSRPCRLVLGPFTHERNVISLKPKNKHDKSVSGERKLVLVRRAAGKRHQRIGKRRPTFAPPQPLFSPTLHVLRETCFMCTKRSRMETKMFSKRC